MAKVLDNTIKLLKSKNLGLIFNLMEEDEEMEKGTCKWFNEKKGFGFIESNGQDYFVHYKEIVSNDQYKNLKPGDKVNFLVGKSPKGNMALKVQLA